MITDDEARALAEVRDLSARVIAVDHFDAAELAARKQQPSRSTQSPAALAPPKSSIAAE